MNNTVRKSIVVVLIALLVAALGIIGVDIALNNTIPEDTKTEETTTTINEDIGFIPSPEVEFVYVVDHESYYHENEMCGAINTLIGFSEMSKELAIHLKFKPCSICCE
jgi:hypothetical protein